MLYLNQYRKKRSDVCFQVLFDTKIAFGLCPPPICLTVSTISSTSEPTRDVAESILLYNFCIFKNLCIPSVSHIELNDILSSINSMPITYILWLFYNYVTVTDPQLQFITLSTLITEIIKDPLKNIWYLRLLCSKRWRYMIGLSVGTVNYAVYSQTYTLCI